MSMKYNKLISLSDEEIIKLYEEISERTSVGLNYYTEEIARRRNEKSNKIMIKLTVAITIMTFIMLICTIINVILFAL